MEPDTGDIVGVAFELQDRVGVGRLDIVEFDGGVAGGREETLIGGDTQAIDLRVGVLDCA